LSIRVRLILGFNLFLAALALLGFFSLRDAFRAHDLSGHIGSVSLDRLVQAGHFVEQTAQLRSLELSYLVADQPDERTAARHSMDASMQNLEDSLSAYQASQSGVTSPDILLSYTDNYRHYLSTHAELMALADGGRTDEALALYNGSAAQYSGLAAQAQTLFGAEQASLDAELAEQHTISARSRVVLIGGLLGVALVIFAVGNVLVAYIHRRLRVLTEGTQRVSRGDFSRPVAVGGGDEFGVLARDFNGMMDSLRAARDQVVRLHAEALRMREERIALLQEGLTREVKAQERERQRVARELHDQAGQALTALQLGLSRFEQGAASSETREMAASLRAMAVDTMGIIRSLALDLRPAALDELGLVSALRQYIKTYSERVGLPVKFEAHAVVDSLPDETKITLFRIVQEALTNVAKHAGASRAWVALRNNGEEFRLLVADNGRGFDTQHALRRMDHQSLGLSGIQERCHLLGGRLEIVSLLGDGSRLRVTIPLAAPLPAWPERQA
jgi:signal transduction histidine kinase